MTGMAILATAALGASVSGVMPATLVTSAEAAPVTASAAVVGNVHAGAPYRVTAWTFATVRNQPRSAGGRVDKVTANHGYDAYCWIHGENINGNTIWVRQLGDARVQGYVPAAYLTGGVTGGVGTKC